jgi:hypothetical protein
MPTTGVINVGLAGTIKVTALVDQALGGNPSLIRDGGINGANYVYNTGGEAGFFARIQGLVDGMAASRTYRSGCPGQTQWKPCRLCRLVGELAGIAAQECGRRGDLQSDAPGA